MTVVGKQGRSSRRDGGHLQRSPNRDEPRRRRAGRRNQVIENPDCVAKSFPDFWQKLELFQ